MRAMTHPIVVTDMDGTLAEAETWRGILAWLAANHPSREASRFVTVRLHRVAFAKVFRRSKEAFRARWMEEQARLLAAKTNAEPVQGVRRGALGPPDGIATAPDDSVLPELQPEVPWQRVGPWLQAGRTGPGVAPC
jgi:hypothetical protein